MSIDEEAGIDSDEIAHYILASSSPYAKYAYDLLLMQTYHRDDGGMLLLKSTIERCKKELADKSRSIYECV